LDPAKRKRLNRFTSARADRAGYRTNLWTTARIAEVIRQKFGVHYHRDHVGRFDAQFAMESRRSPNEHALERKEPAIERWKQKRLAADKKKSCAAGCPFSLRR